MITFSWFRVDTSFVWASGFVAGHRIFNEMATSPDRAKEKTLEYLSEVGATDVVVHSVTPESEPVSPLPKQVAYRKPMIVTAAQEIVDTPKSRALF